MKMWDYNDIYFLAIFACTFCFIETHRVYLTIAVGAGIYISALILKTLIHINQSLQDLVQEQRENSSPKTE